MKQDKRQKHFKTIAYAAEAVGRKIVLADKERKSGTATSSSSRPSADAPEEVSV